MKDDHHDQSDYEHSIFAYVMMGCFFCATGGANASALFDASRTCGAAGEWKRRVAEELSAVYFVGGWEVPKKGGTGFAFR